MYQVTIITTDGKRFVANSVQNQVLFWAIRGSGAGQSGVVTEFILKTYPLPDNMVTGGFSFHATSHSNASESVSWNAMAELASLIPDIMDTGLTDGCLESRGKCETYYVSLDTRWYDD